MKFINRKQELKILNEYYSFSQKRLFTVAVSGLRRVGKTTLIKEFIKDKKALYFFVYDSKTSLELLREFSEELRKQKIIAPLEAITSWYTFFEVIFTRCKKYVIVFDEFQNFQNADKTVFSILQKNCDEYKETPLNLIMLGSLIGLFRKIFEDKKQPLYGRISAKINLQPFTLQYSIETLQILKYKNFAEMLRIYGIFGGFPKYYAAMEQFELFDKDYASVIKYLFIQENAPLGTEVSDILKQEFGKRSSLYYSIIHSIAVGKAKLNEIASNVHMKESSITRHLRELEERFSLIKSVKPIDNKKNTRYFLNHPLIEFWFVFVYDQFSYYSLQNTEQLIENITHQFNAFFGRRFEEICREFLIHLNTNKKLPFTIEYLSNWWGYKREWDERKEIEIDFLGVSKQGKILFVECKWKENVDAEEILKQLKEKSAYVNWHKNKREEHFCIIAKSFKKKVGQKNVLLFDLKDMAKELRRQ
ncbi:ATP-binding protein [Candidatus Woesearchaeota archaeon]|nr:ATP-binding protein [Candidatus Woesearchaeota archaeon]